MSKEPVPEFGTGSVLLYVSSDEDWENPVYLENVALRQIGGRWFAVGRIPEAAVEAGSDAGGFAVAWDTVDAFAVPDDNQLRI